MRKFKLLAIGAFVISLAVTQVQAENKFFGAGISFDTAATASFADLQKIDSKSATYGASLGVNAFVSKRFGIGAEINSQSPETGTLVDEINGKAIWRLPVTILAPQVFGGGGYLLESKQADVFGGGGVELKLWRNTSAFADGRYVYVPEAEKGFAMARLGLRHSF